MNVLLSIFGLAVLILLHEAGHFFVARAVGMRPRRFYLGFPPALVKVVRNGIEYGIGAIPLGGYVKIPGMHRPAASDLDMQLGPALKEDPSLFPKMARVQRGLEAGDLVAAREAMPELAAAVEDADLSPAAGKAARQRESGRLMVWRREKQLRQTKNRHALNPPLQMGLTPG